MNIIPLTEDYEHKLEQFLSRHSDSSMFLRGNLQRAGISYHGAPFQGEYFGVFDQNNEIQGVLAHYWNGNIIIQCPAHAGTAAFAEQISTLLSREIAGFIGPSTQAQALMQPCGFDNLDYSLKEDERLYALNLTNLITPPPLPKTWTVRQTCKSDYDLLVSWMTGYATETLGYNEPQKATEWAEQEAEQISENNNKWLLEIEETPVCLSGFNAALSDSVQIGGVWTPPEFRNKAYARTLVARTLLEAREVGVKRAVLFTKNPAAIKAYEAIGFTFSQNYRLAFLKTPVSP